MKKYITLLRSSSLFAGIGDDDIEKLLHCLGAYQRSYPAGDRIWLTGDRVKCAGIVLSGAVYAESYGYNGRLTTAAHHGPGHIFGDILMSGGGRSPVDIVAETDTEVLFIPFGRVMDDCGKRCPCHLKLRLNLIGEISDKFWAMRRRISYLTAGSLRAKLALFLLDGCRSSGADAFDCNMTRQALAANLGSNRSAMCRELGRMQREGLISCHHRSFCVLNRPGLINILNQG